MSEHPVVSKEAWLEARKELLAKEKELSKMRDAISRQRRELPWVKVEKTYTFEGPDGKETLADLFAGRGQLIVYHFMFHPDWEAGCKSCSFLTDHYQGAIAHLAARDVTLVAVSRAPLEKLLAFEKRMGWTHKWVSSYGSDFNYDFQVSFTPEQMDKKTVVYNYAPSTFPQSEAPGISVFAKGKDGAVYHTYSTFSRGLDTFINAYNFLDLVPKGRDEEGLQYSMTWVRLHDEYP